PPVEELGHAVRALGVVELRQGEQEIRRLLTRRQVVARERVEMRRRGHGCRSSSRTAWNTPYPHSFVSALSFSSPPRKRGPIFQSRWLWGPAFAGTTAHSFSPPRAPSSPVGSSTARVRSRSSVPRWRLHRYAAPVSPGRVPRP